jgi:hypothetical protein
MFGKSQFDGDSCFNSLHYEFYLGWIDAFQGNSQVFPEISTHPIVISDPLHLMKRIHYRWIRRTLSFGLGGQELLYFSTKIQKAGFLSPVVFLQSQNRKRHNPLLFRFFSTCTLAVIFRDNLRAELSMAP